MDWIVDVDQNKQNILWLHGLAGSGKSTIANTISARLYELGRLGAFLFFERDKTDRDAVIHTIAAQLADADTVLRSRIGTAIERDRRIVNSHLEKQFADLLRRPIHDAVDSLVGPMVIVIDALDEFGDTSSRQLLLNLISDEFTKLPNNFRFFITSRREPDIDSMLSDNPTIKSMSLTDMRDNTPAIRLYMLSELARIRKVKRMPANWPQETDLDGIAEMSEGLFIWASTLSKFLLDTTDPAAQLSRILYSQSNRHAKGLDNLYATVLTTRNDWGEGLDERFRDIMGIVLFCNIPLVDVWVDQFLDLPQDRSCRLVFQDFHCLFDYTPGWPIIPLHASFCDYLTDETRSGGKPWSLAGFDPDHHLALCCLRVMHKQLRFNICNFETSHRLNDDYPDLQDRIRKHLTLPLQYASLQWWHHLQRVRTGCEDVISALRLFSTKVLFWLEVISLIGEEYELKYACAVARSRFWVSVK